MLRWGLTHHFFSLWKMVSAFEEALSLQVTEEIVWASMPDSVACMLSFLLLIPGIAWHK